MAACEDLFRDALTLKVALHLVEASKLSRLVTKVCGFRTVRSDGSVMRGICQLPVAGAPFPHTLPAPCAEPTPRPSIPMCRLSFPISLDSLKDRFWTTHPPALY